MSTYNRRNCHQHSATGLLVTMAVQRGSLRDAGEIDCHHVPVMKAPLKDSLRVSETIFPPAPVPRVRTVTAVAEASTPTLMPPITMAELGPSIRIKSFIPAVTFKSHGNGSIGAADIQHHALDEQILASAVGGINRDGPIAVVILVLRHPRHNGIACPLLPSPSAFLGGCGSILPQGGRRNAA